MMKTTWMTLVGAVGAVVLGACGSSSGTGGTGAGGSGGSATTSSSTTTSNATSSSSGGSNMVNGCDPTTAMDMTGSTTVTITFPATPTTLAYSPACIKVKKGTMVTFSGDFTFHPLGGGNSPPTVDTTSPITETKTGMSATFNIANAGNFGFFCEFHQSLGMKGAIFSM